MTNKIRVKNSGLISLQIFKDYPDGNLAIAETNKSIPFAIKRVYYINNLDNPKAIRGKHAHKKTEQIIFCLNGHFTLDLDDGKTKQTLTLRNNYSGVLLGKMLWHNMRNFSKDCIILVISNNIYKENDYIRDYRTFIKSIKKSESHI